MHKKCIKKIDLTIQVLCGTIDNRNSLLSSSIIPNFLEKSNCGVDGLLVVEVFQLECQFLLCRIQRPANRGAANQIVNGHIKVVRYLYEHIKIGLM